MTRRLLGAALLALLLVITVLPAAASAVEDTGTQTGAQPTPAEGAEAEGPPSIEEIGTDVARSEGFFPEEYVSPSWFQWALYPAIVIGVIMTIGLLLYYLFRQPSFAAEREKSRK